MRLLRIAARYHDPNEDRSHINGRLHALRVGGAMDQYGDELGFIGLVHDLARPLNDVFHGEVIAEMVRDRVSAVNYLVLREHGKFQDAIVHNRELRDWPASTLGLLPSQAVDFQIVSGMLAGAEVASFSRDYQGESMEIYRAHELIRKFLG